MIYKALSVISALLVLASCAWVPDLYDKPFSPKQSIDCPGINKPYVFVAGDWSQAGDDLWLNDPFVFANIFDFDMDRRIRSQVATAVLEYDETNSLLRLRMLSRNKDTVSEVRIPGKIVECHANRRTVIHSSRIIAGDGARETTHDKLEITQLARKVEIKMHTERHSSLIFISSTRQRNYRAIFDEAR